MLINVYSDKISDFSSWRSLGEFNLTNLLLDIFAASGRYHLSPILLVVNHFYHDRVVFGSISFDHPSWHLDTKIIFIVVALEFKINFDEVYIVCHVIINIFLVNFDCSLVILVVNFDIGEIVKSIKIFIDS